MDRASCRVRPWRLAGGSPVSGTLWEPDTSRRHLSLFRAALGCADYRLGGGEPRDRDPVGRAADVVETCLIEQVDRLRVATVLSADTELEVGPRLAAALG